ncbi:Retrovirus-related Pol polyprotein from transposon TNT 1-94 [Senna tora]|uniref:Retrovirus-related Pol polyprotein from transposon TNT 1-94 n=1 Tax=Senna tora TaxID=362788 RepID=A0A834SFG6_9FABA|nr:Retrovirus-related Pol polyprotein from transposon TNT 1-94 [Senna tora]
MEITDKGDKDTNSVLATLTNLASNTKFALQNSTQPISSKLDDNNYLSWRMLALATIRGHNLYHFLLGESHIPTRYTTYQDRANGTCSDEYLNWECQDQLLASWLLNSMSDGVVSKMVGCVHSYQVWNKVEELFCSSTRARERQLKNDLRSLKKGSTSMSEFLLKIKKIVDSLGAIGSPISTHDHIESIFDGLDREYESFMTSFSMRKEEYSVTEIEALLLSQEARIDKLKKVVDNVSANVAHQGGYRNNRPPNQFFGQRGGYQGRGNNQGSSNGVPFLRGGFPGRGRGQYPSQPQNRGGGQQTWQGTRPQCQVCGKMGHIAINCYNRYNQSFTPASLAQIINQNQNRPNSGAAVEALLATPEILSEDAWFADSGSSNHLTNNLSNLQVSQPYDGGEQVHIANGSGLTIHNIGSSELQSSSNSFKLNQILHDNNEVLLRGRNKQGLYVFDNLNFASKDTLPLVSANTATLTSSAPSTVTSQFRLWHNRLGHPSTTVVKSVLNACNLNNVNKDTHFFCEPCCMGKIHALPFPSSSSSYTKPLELVPSLPSNPISSSPISAPSITVPSSLPSHSSVNTTATPNVSSAHPMITRAKSGIFKPLALVSRYWLVSLPVLLE